MPRLFVGLEPPDRVIADILTLREPISGVRWQSAAQLHLTLAFIGQVDSACQSDIVRAMRQIRMSPIRVRLRAPECPGNSEHPRHLWLPAEPADALADLHLAIVRALADLGIKPDSRRFRPHVTLARFKRQAGSVRAFLAAHAQHSLPGFAVTRFALFTSTPTPAGSRYDVVEQFELTD